MSRLFDKSGFTIVELVVVITVLSLLMGVVLNTLGGLYTSNANSAAITTQDTDTRSALRQIDKDISMGVAFSNSSTVTSPLGPSESNNTWTYDPNADKTVLIASEYATVPTTNMVVYKNSTPTSCSVPDPNVDTLSKVQVIYYVAANSRTGTDSLYRRLIVDADACTGQGIAQKTSCSAVISRATYPICQANDAVLLDNVQQFKIKYFQNPYDTAVLTGAAITGATTAEISVKTKPQSADRPASTATIRISLNTINS